MLTRRQFLTLCALSPLLMGAGQDFLTQVPDTSRFPTLKEMESWMDGWDKNQVEIVGYSPQGRALRLLTCQPGKSRTALFLAAVHANEPHGLPTVRFLAEALDKPGSDLSKLYPDTTFLFFPVVDPDGLALNDGLFGKPRTLENYLLQYYRPSLADTAVYTFPFPSSTYPPTSGCKAIMRVMERYKPSVVNELHGCEFGTSIYWSGDSEVDEVQGLIWDRYGLPSAEKSVVHKMLTIAEKKAAGKSPKGGATVDFARRFNNKAQTINIELGLWRNPMLYDTSSSGVSRATADQFYHDTVQAGLVHYEEFFPSLTRLLSDHPLGNARLYFDAFAERAKMPTFSKLPEVSKSQASLSHTDLFHIVGGPLILLLRNYALLAGLSRELGEKKAETACRDYIRTTWRRAEQDFLMHSRPVSIRKIVQTLAGAGLWALG